MGWMPSQISSKLMYTVEKETIPTKNRWSLRAVARYLSADCGTVRHYHSDIAPVITDYRNDCRRLPNGNISGAGGINPYQAWVLTKIIGLSRLIAEDLRGTSYKKVVKSTIIEKADLLSKKSYLQEIGNR